MNLHRTTFTSGADLVERARSLSELITSEAEASDKAGTMTDRVYQALSDADLFWVLVPQSLGGLQSDLLTCLSVWEEISRADGSAGWSLMANSTGTAVAAGFCSDEAVEEMFGGDRKPIMAGMLGPGGTCVEVDGGYRGSGKYKFGSGSLHASWLGAGMLIQDGEGIRKHPDGSPQVRVMFVPRDKVAFKSNWDVLGLTGTGSVDYDLPDVFVPAGNSLERTDVQSRRDWQIYNVGIAGLACAGHTGVALGLMKRALEEITTIAFGRKRPAYQTVLGEHPVFRHDFAYHEAQYRAARAFTFDVYRDAQETIARGETLTAAQRMRFRQNVIYTHRVASEVVTFCYVQGGSDSLRNPSALGRCMRDMHAATQHIFVDTNAMVDVATPIIAEWRDRAPTGLAH
ncbi:MAG: acyl-CoA dehydrogenase family protein [Microvirga sp.]